MPPKSGFKRLFIKMVYLIDLCYFEKLSVAKHIRMKSDENDYRRNDEKFK